MSLEPVSQAFLAEVFQVSERTIRRWRREGLDIAEVDDPTRTSRTPTFDLAAAVAWKVTYEIERQLAAEVRAAGEGEEDVPLGEAKRRYTVARARRAEFEAREAERKAFLAEGRVVLVEDAVALNQALAALLRERIAQLPNAWSPDLLGIKNRKEAVVRLRELTGRLQAEIRAKGRETLAELGAPEPEHEEEEDGE